MSINDREQSNRTYGVPIGEIHDNNGQPEAASLTEQVQSDEIVQALRANPPIFPPPELPDDSPHVEYWDDVEAVCEVAKLLFVENLVANPQQIAERSVSVASCCMTAAEELVKVQRQYKTNAADGYLTRLTQRTSRI